MGPIKIYLAGAWSGGGTKENELIQLGVRHKLCSYAYPKQLEGWFTNIPNVPPGDRGAVMVDSGAFSAWNKGRTIPFEEYIEYAHQAITKAEELGMEIHIVNLDVIPGKVGETSALTRNFCNPKNKELIEQAAKQGYRNLLTMLKNGIKPIHVFHQGESWKWLDRMIEKVDYIGISPANDVANNIRREWVDSVFEYLHKHDVVHVRTHGFAVHAHKMLSEYPWTSCDSASWRIAAGFGWVYVPAGGFSNPDFSKDPIIYPVSDVRTEIGLGKMTQRIAKAIELSGHSIEEVRSSWEVRARLNLTYFLALEDALNQQRKRHDYKPRARLL